MADTAQEAATAIYEKLAAAEAAAASEGATGTQAALGALHNALAEGWTFLKDTDLDLDWNATIGYTPPAKGAQTQGGGPKPEPSK